MAWSCQGFSKQKADIGHRSCLKKVNGRKMKKREKKDCRHKLLKKRKQAGKVCAKDKHLMKFRVRVQDGGGLVVLHRR